MKHKKSAKIVSFILATMMMCQMALSTYAQEVEQFSPVTGIPDDVPMYTTNYPSDSYSQDDITLGQSESEDVGFDKKTVFSIDNPIFASNSDSTIYVELGTPIDAVPLPKETTVKMKGQDGSYEDIYVNIAWKSDDYNANLDGIYTFTAMLPETYELEEGIVIPTATVAVGNAGAVEFTSEIFEVSNAGIASDAGASSFSSNAFFAAADSGSYPYGSQLNDFAKQIYDGMMNISVPYNNEFQNYPITIQNVKLPFSGGSLTSEGNAIFKSALQSAYDAAMFDNQYLFWLRESGLGAKIEGTSVGSEVIISSVILRAESIKYFEPQAMVLDLKQNIANVNIAGSTRAEKAKNIHDWIANQVKYDQAASNNVGNGSIFNPNYSYAFEAYGVFAPDKTVVCEGYSKAFKLLCEENNIPCVLVVGQLNGVPHMWNYVQMDDGNWYGVDVTNDDDRLPNGSIQVGQVLHDLFLVGSDTVIEFAPNKPTFSQFDIPQNNFSQNGIHFTYPTLSRERYKEPVPDKSKLSLVFDKASYSYGDIVRMTATVERIPSTRSVQEVEFLIGDVSLGKTELDADGSAVLVYDTKTGTIPLGTSTITVLYSGDSDVEPSSTTEEITINKAALDVAPSKIEQSFLYSESGNKTIDLSGFVATPNGLNLQYRLGNFSDTQSVLNGIPTVTTNSLVISLKGQEVFAEKTLDIPIIISADNYNDTTVTVSIKLINKTLIAVSGINVESGKIYNKSAIQVTGTPVYKLDNGTMVNPTTQLIYTYSSTDGKGYNSTVAPVNAGEYALTLSLDDTQYMISSAAIPFSIAKKPVSITGLVAPDHPYDGKTEVQLNHEKAEIQGIIDGDILTAVYPATGTAASANVGTGVKVTFPDITLSGDSEGNYVLNEQPIITVKIVEAAPLITFAKVEQSADYTGNMFAIEAPTITMSDGSIPPSAANISYYFKLKTSETWLTGLPVDVGSYDVKALLPADGNFLKAESAVITVNILAITPPDGSYTIPTGLKAVANFQGMLSEIKLPENWTWKNPSENLDVNKSKYMAVYTPTNPNHKVLEIELTVAVTKIDVKYTDKNNMDITILNLSKGDLVDINAIISGTTDTLVWSTSDAAIATAIGTNSAAVITAKEKGAAIIGLSLDGKLLKGILVKVSDSGETAYTPENIIAIIRDLKGKNPMDNKAVINDVARAMKELSATDKLKLTADSIKDIDALYSSANNVSVNLQVNIASEATRPINNATVDGAAIASNGASNVQITVTQRRVPIDTPNAAFEVEMSMTADNVAIQPVTPIYFTVEMKSPITIEKIIHHKSDGTTETIAPYYQDGSRISVLASSFSSFSFMTKVPVVPTPPTNNGNGSIGGGIIEGTTGSGSYYPNSNDYSGSGSNSNSSSSSSSQSSTVSAAAQKDFWNTVLDKIKSAKDGDTVKINAKSFDKMPVDLLKALRGNDVTFIIKWNGGDDIAINGENLISWEKQRLYYPLSKLLALYKDIPVKFEKTMDVKIESPIYKDDSSTKKSASTENAQAESSTTNTGLSKQTAGPPTSKSGSSTQVTNPSYSGVEETSDMTKDNPETGTVIEISAPGEAEMMSSTTPMDAGFEQDATLPLAGNTVKLPAMIAVIAGILAAATILALTMYRKYKKNN